MNDNLLCLSLSKEDLEFYCRLRLLVVNLEGVEITRLDLNRIDVTAYWLS